MIDMLHVIHGCLEQQGILTKTDRIFELNQVAKELPADRLKPCGGSKNALEEWFTAWLGLAWLETGSSLKSPPMMLYDQVAILPKRDYVYHALGGLTRKIWNSEWVF
jgi:hypothetical protein